MNEIKVPHNAMRVIDLLEAAGFEAYVVGGCVRDALLGTKPNDWDICTSALPEQTKSVMAAAEVKTYDTGIKHGTITVVADGEPFEVTTYRADGTYSDGRHPDEVEFLERIDGDLSRRDFTINAMAYSPTRGFVDHFGGQCDLSAYVLRTVGDPAQRFEEDGLRIMRALRFAASYGLIIEQGTAAALHECKHLLGNVSVERIWSELEKLLCAKDVVHVLREYRDVVAVVIAELKPTFGFNQHNPFHKYDVWEHTLHVLAAAPPSMGADLRFALLLHDIAKPQCRTFDERGLGHMYGHERYSAEIARNVCKRLHVPNAVKDTVVHAVRWHMFSIPDTPKAMRRFLVKHGEQGVRNLFEVRKCDIAGFGHEIPDDAPMSIAFAKAQRLFEEQMNAQPVFGVKDLAIDGRDLLGLGFAQGPDVGHALRKLLEAVVDGTVQNDRQILLESAKTML